MVTISGSRLSHHNIDHSLDYSKLGAEKSFELVILQGGSGETNSSLERKVFADKASEMIQKIHKAGAEAALYMIHAYVEPHENSNPQMIKDIKKMYIDVGNKNNILVIPVGLAFAEINKNFPAINLYTRDKRHPSKLGTYLAACVIFSSVYKKTPEGNSFLFGLDPNKAKIIQQVAWQVSSDFYTGK